MFWLFLSFYFSLASVKYVRALDILDQRFYINVCYNEASRHLDTSGKFKHESMKDLCFGKKNENKDPEKKYFVLWYSKDYTGL